MADFSGYTPGPWRSGTFSGIVGCPIVAQPDKGQNSLVVASIMGGRTQTEVHNNARLIAAAPELLRERDEWRAIADQLAKVLKQVLDGFASDEEVDGISAIQRLLDGGFPDQQQALNRYAKRLTGVSVKDHAEKRYRPFSSGSQYLDWENSNCCQCSKYSDDASTCDIMMALAGAACSDGSVAEEIAERMGYLDHSPPRQQGYSYVWPCNEGVGKEDEQ